MVRPAKAHQGWVHRWGRRTGLGPKSRYKSGYTAASTRVRVLRAVTRQHRQVEPALLLLTNRDEVERVADHEKPRVEERVVESDLLLRPRVGLGGISHHAAVNSSEQFAWGVRGTRATAQSASQRARLRVVVVDAAVATVATVSA